jgi:hypothetical protein
LEASGGAGAYFSSLGAGVGTKKSVRFVDERQEQADRLALRASRTARPQEADALLGDDRDGDGDADGMGGGRGGERVAFAPRAALRDFVPLDGEASDWENEVVSRGRQGGALHAAPLPPSTHALYGALAGVSATPAWVPSGANGGGGGLGGGGVAEGGLTIDDVRRALARAADALATVAALRLTLPGILFRAAGEGARLSEALMRRFAAAEAARWTDYAWPREAPLCAR